MNKKLFLIPFALGVIVVACMGAMIHEYPADSNPSLTSFTLLDTWNGSSGAYNSVRLSDIMTKMFTSPTFTGTVTVNGAVSTNELGGVNIITNINGTTIPSPFTFASLADATNAALTIASQATNGLPMGVTASGSATATTNASGVVNIAVAAAGGDVTTAQLVSATNITLTTATDRITAATNAVQGFHYGTNQGALTINLALGEWFAFSTNNNIALADLEGVSTFGTNVQKFSLILTNTSGATKTITTPAAWIPTGITLYNTNQGFLTGVVYPGMGTNYAYKALQ